METLNKIEGVKAVENLSLCTESGAAIIADAIKKYNLKRVIVAACTPRTHLPVFQAVLRDANLPPRMLEFVNIREHCSFVHMQAKDKATQKALRLIEAGLQRVKLLEEVPTKAVDVTPRALVIGGGIGGLSAAVELGEQGYEVVVVEKNPTIGGRMAQLDRTFPTDDCSI